MTPTTQRLRHDTRRRSLTVTQTHRLTPNMLRLRLEGDLGDFVSASPGDHIKLFVPTGGAEVMRDYTPRRFDAAAGWLEIDFALHEAGPATLWALGAQVGDAAVIGGPRGSLVIGGVQSWLLIGDETALPAIARRIEELPAGVQVTSVVAVPGPQDVQQIATTATHRAFWVHRADPTDASGLLQVLATLQLAPETFVWIAAEAGVARAARDALPQVPPEWLRAAGYWLAGQADAAVKEL
ncbi:siderophore-interacting protein [Rhodobacter sp. KR11]|uniref:siderophore-interacting protein n=1 Tax=Rhodobacter sp. KR11 TaxID=2974588 RepID=UPI002221CA58|nr:siderophore-interacting protein [Rhodobacter sp. KR11]MCW1917934.1 siderophore-interacting protein [Rhodobacter sp. KR11]